jgi:predicted transcriptional regulator
LLLTGSVTNRKRNFLEITQEILRTLDENNDDPIAITSLMYVINITSSITFHSKLEPLLQAGYIEAPLKNKYKITDRGREYLKILDQAIHPYIQLLSKKK